MRKAKEQRKKAVGVVRMLALLLLLLPVSCINDNYNDEQVTPYSDGSVGVEMTIQTLAVDENEGYVIGTSYENYIDIAGGDYRIYFFTYDPKTETEAGKGTSSTLIAEFTPTDIYSTDSDAYTTYYVSGEVDPAMANYTDFKVVMLANWGTYPSVTPGTTTIDDICNAETAVFNAFVDNTGTSPAAAMPSSSLHIPFYGVHEYSGVTWKSGWRTNLDGVITLLRAVAKVEVILTNGTWNGTWNDDTDDGYDGAYITFKSVVLNRYNAQGYCAPSSVYLQSDYDSGYTNRSSDFANTLHLVNDSNDTTTEKSITLYKTINNDGLETWVGYIPEYDNSDTDYCYISATTNYQFPEDDPYRIYFANYTNGTTTAYDADGYADDRFDVFRNNLYRFNVTLTEGGLVVTVDKWEDVFDNEWSFGEMSHLEEEGFEFTFDGITYEVKVVRELEDGEEDEMESYGYHLEVWITVSTSKYTGEFVIPQTVTHFGYTYTITGIEGNCFFGDEDLTSVQIPATVTWIGNEAFGECTSLQSVYILATTPPECGEDIFHDDVTDALIIFVPVGCLDAYRKHETWGQFEIQEIDYGN